MVIDHLTNIDINQDSIWNSGKSINESPPAIIRDITEFPDSKIGVAGSGSSWESFFSNLSGSHRLIISPELPNLPIASQVYSGNSRMVEVLDTIRHTFGLTWDQLAKICGKERRTLYNWRDGLTEPQPAAIERLFMLYRAARDWQDAGYPTVHKTMLRAPMLGDLSLFDLLTAEKIKRDAIDYIGSRMAMDSMEQQLLTDPFA